jgi:hypothetical protein
MAELTPKHQIAPVAAQDAASSLDARRVSLVKGGHRWHFQWSAGDEASLIARVAELARDPHVPFDWFDAAVVCRHVAPPRDAATPVPSTLSPEN